MLIGSVILPIVQAGGATGKRMSLIWTVKIVRAKGGYGYLEPGLLVALIPSNVNLAQKGIMIIHGGEVTPIDKGMVTRFATGLFRVGLPVGIRSKIKN